MIVTYGSFAALIVMLMFRHGPEPAQFPEGAAVREPRAEPPGVLHHRGQDPRLRRQLAAQGETQSSLFLHEEQT